MKKAICAVTFCMMIALMCSCSKKITQGEVINKEYTPSYTTIMMIPIVHTNGKTTTTQIIPFVYRYSDKYEITILGYDSEKNESTATYRVKKEVFDQVNLGDEFVFSKEYEPEYPEYIRKKK